MNEPFVGVSAEVSAAMHACEATVLAEDGLLLRTCVHGQRHPVGYLHSDHFQPDSESWKHRHEIAMERGLPRRGQECDGCCLAWQ